jgi:hypothetical protein
MDNRFDELAKRLSRGAALKAFGTVMLGILVAPKSAEAKRKKKRRRRPSLVSIPVSPPPPPEPPICNALEGDCCIDPSCPPEMPPKTCRCKPPLLCYGHSIDRTSCGTPLDCAGGCGYYKGGICRMSVDGSLWLTPANSTGLSCETNEECPSGLCVKGSPACPSFGNTCAAAGATPLRAP